MQQSLFLLQIANGSRVYAMYSTPACYTYAVNRGHPFGWPLKRDDFLPIAKAPHGFWSGYFSSRSALKGYERSSMGLLRVSLCPRVADKSRRGILFSNINTVI